MIFQLNYNDTQKYDKYYESNLHITKHLEHKIFYHKDIYEFLEKYNYTESFEKLKFDNRFLYCIDALKCDFLRLIILYELGGVYVDSDCIFTEIIDESEFINNLVMHDSLSLFFISSNAKNPVVKYMIEQYITKQIKHDILMFNKLELMKQCIIHNEKISFETDFKFIIHEKITTK